MTTNGTHAPATLKGLAVADTALGGVRGAEGFYHYRQYAATDLALHRPFEDVWQLMFDGELPRTHAAREAFAREVRPLRALPEDLRALLPGIASGVAPLPALRAALSLAGSSLGVRPLVDADAGARRSDALRVAAVTPTLVAALHRLRTGAAPVEPLAELGHGANYLRMLTGEEPAPQQARAIERYLTSTIDHGFNASTFTARVVASTGADVAAAVVAALGALEGPLHGGAPSRALELLAEIGTPDRAADVVAAKVAAGERIMGFGHAVYRTEDPRSAMLRDVAIELGGPLVELAVQVEARVVDVLAELKPGRQLYANVEYYAAVVMAACGVPPELFTPTFATSRVVGWCANVLEQASEPGIIRPDARYLGPPPPQPVPDLLEAA